MYIAGFSSIVPVYGDGDIYDEYWYVGSRLRSAILSMRREDKHTMPLLVTELAVGRTRHSLGLSIRNRVSKSTHSLPTTTYTYVLKPLAS